MALPNNLTADWCRRDTREKVLALPRGLSAPPQLIAGANAPQWEYPILPQRVGPHLPPSVLGEPRTMAPNSQARDFHAKAQPGNGIILNFEKKDTLVNPFNPLSGLCDGPRLPEMDADCCALCSMRITGYMKRFACSHNSAYCYFCYLEHAKHMTRWQTTGEPIPDAWIKLLVQYKQAQARQAALSPEPPAPAINHVTPFDPDTMVV